MGLPIVSEEFRLVGDPQLLFTNDGTPYCRMLLVTSSREEKPKGSGTWVDKDTLWINATAWRKPAENAAESLVDKDLVIVTGEIYTHKYTTKEGVERQATAMNVRKIGPSLTFRSTPHGVTEQNRQANAARPSGQQQSTQTQDEATPPF